RDRRVPRVERGRAAHARGRIAALAGARARRRARRKSGRAGDAGGLAPHPGGEGARRERRDPADAARDRSGPRGALRRGRARRRAVQLRQALRQARAGGRSELPRMDVGRRFPREHEGGRRQAPRDALRSFGFVRIRYQFARQTRAIYASPGVSSRNPFGVLPMADTMMNTNYNRMLAMILGWVLLLVGVLGFIPGITQHGPGPVTGHGTPPAKILGIFEVNMIHSVVHVLSGLVLLAGAYMAGGANARTYNIVLGAVYIVVFLAGIAVSSIADAVAI